MADREYELIRSTMARNYSDATSLRMIAQAFERLVELLDTERALTTRAPSQTTQKALVQEVIDFMECYFVNERDFEKVASFLREQFGG